MGDEEGHLALVVEHDEKAREEIGDALAALGHRVRFASSVDGALKALEKEDFCYLCVADRLPLRSGARALEGAGERVIAVLRERDRRRAPSDFHVTPILVTSEATGHEVVSRVYDLGGSGFVARPLQGRAVVLRDKVTTCLARGGRGEHWRCKSYALVTSRTREGLAPVRIDIDGTTNRRVTTVMINGTERGIQDAKLAVLMKLVVAHLRAHASWSSREALGVVQSREALSRIRVAFRGLAPDGFEVIEGDGNRRFRLNPAVMIGKVAWEVLAEHGNAVVRKVAREELERVARKK